ncbi:Endospore coat-associated protein YheD [compost metagenome]
MLRPHKGVIGILVSESKGPFPFSENNYCRKLCLIGNKQGMHIYVFCPSSITQDRSTVQGYCYEKGNWNRRSSPLPDILYDRCFSHVRKDQQRKQNALSLLYEKQPFIYLARGLTGKWSVYQVLKKYPDLTLYLPETHKYTGVDQLSEWLRAHDGQVFMKPQNGTHGKRTMHIKVSSPQEGLRLIGRDNSNNIFKRKFPSVQEGFEWIHKFIGNRPFLLQTYLNLNSTQGEPFDIRVLMQKNSKGIWEITGRAARVGQKHSLTSNLHGGGSAHKALPFLCREFGENGGRNAITVIDHLSRDIPLYLESHFGRLAELGIDFGVDRQGKVWILEVNSKPGRSSFFRIGDYKSARKSIENPIGYARYLLLSKP